MRLASTVKIAGRLFAYYLALFTGGNGLPVYPTVYAVTSDGYRYQVDLRGMDPNGWLAPESRGNAGEIVVRTSRRRAGSVVLSLPAILEHVSRALHAQPGAD